MSTAKLSNDNLLLDSVNLDESAESVVRLCTELRNIGANHPDVELSCIEAELKRLVALLDEQLCARRDQQVQMDGLSSDVITLEKMLHEEKCLRRTELNDSFNVQELLNDEKETLVVNNNLLTSSLSKLGSKFKDVTNEQMSLRLELENKDAVIDEISKDLKTCTLETTNFTSTVENLKAQLKEAENKAWSSSRWLDDKVLDSYFDAFKIDDELSFRKTLYLGPTITQLLKLGSDEFVGVLLKDLSFTSADFAFCYVGDNEAVLADDAGSHWSLLFIDIKANDTLTEATVGLTFRCAGSGVGGGLESGGVGPLGGDLLIEDSILKYSGRGCALAGAEVDVNPGARIHNIKEKLIRTYVNNQPKVVFIHVGTNNLCKNYNGGEGYNGGWGKRAVLQTMADLLNVARHSFPNSLIMLSGVLLRNDISALAIANFNEQLALMCNNFGVLFVDANLWLLRRHLARDGGHLNRIGNGHFDVFILNRVREVLEVCEMPGGDRFHESVVAESPVEPTVSPSRSEGSAKRPENWGDGDRRSHGYHKSISVL
ncbi:hypothetical protein J6590_025692 [Homalodisca vitripennis]|nr:hypothetical protein J6590_025692 [Homalodisca vitripennis]